MDAAIQRLFSRRRFGMKPGLDRMQALLGELGNPERGFVPIHVAGTNGKGSVCALLDAILRQAGFRVGLFTSPHLVRVNERFRVDGADITDAAMLALAEQVETAADAAAQTGGTPATFFECTAAMACAHFRQTGVQIGILETGLGGRMDATNVVTPVVSVITRIGLEHTEWLGNTLAEIAREKGGIIKAERPVVCGAMPEEAFAALAGIARAEGSPLIRAEERVSVTSVKDDLGGQDVRVATSARDYGRVRLPLPGRHQLENLGTAIAAAEVFADAAQLPLPEEAVREGVAAVRWPGRLQLLRAEPPVLVDGAHNPAAGRALAAALRGLRKDRRLGLVVGMLADKDAAGFLKEFRGLAQRLWLVPVQNERNMPAPDLVHAAAQCGFEPTSTELPVALDQATAWAAQENGLVCVAGSIYLAGEALGAVGIAHANADTSQTTP